MITLNGQPVNTTLFPDNTSQVWHLPEYLFEADSNWVHIVWDFQHEGEFMQLAQLKNLLDKYGIRAALRLEYLPYGRQDKNISNDTTFALHSFAHLLNVLKFDEVICMDPHSAIAEASIKNFRAVYPTKMLEDVILETITTLVCYPDKGALVKYREVYKGIVEDEYIYGEKVRDQLTGKITKYEIINKRHNLKEHNVLLVDDIVDGGMTFKILANGLLDAGAKEVNLFVSHGIFSKGLKTLLESGIKRVFTKDGEIGEYQNNITFRRLK